MNRPIIWLRAEYNLSERRAALVPQHAEALKKAGYRVIIEKSSQRIFRDEEYIAAGCEPAEPHSWMDSPADTCVIGFKGIPDGDFPIRQRHFYAAHCFDGEAEARILRRFDRGGGVLYGLELFDDALGHQVIMQVPGQLAGMIGVVLALKIWHHRRLHIEPPYQFPSYFNQVDDLLSYLDGCDFDELTRQTSCVIIAPHGNVGKSACQLLTQLNIPFDRWARKETARDDVGRRLLNYQLAVNCISIDNIAPDIQPPKLLTFHDLSASPEHHLRVLADISCYPTHPKNVLPLYSSSTTFADPTIRVGGIDILALDNLPTLLPKECSIGISRNFMPYLAQFLLLGNELSGSSIENVFRRFCTAVRV